MTLQLYLTLPPICDKLCLLGCSILPKHFRENLISWNIHKAIPIFCFTHLLHSGELTICLISLFAICVEKNLTVVQYFFHCCVLFLFKRKEPRNIFVLNNCDNADLLTIDKFSSSIQGCSQTKWETLHGMDAQTRFEQKNLLSLLFVIRYSLINYEVFTW